MDTIRVTDYFAPLTTFPIFEKTPEIQRILPIAVHQRLSSKQSRNALLSQLDRADIFTYLIMGLAVLIAIVVPLLNLN